MCKLLTHEEQLEIVFWKYQKGSRRRETRERGGKKDGGVQLSIKDNTPIYKTFAKVLKLDENKTEFFSLIADTLSELFKEDQKMQIITRQRNVLCSHELNSHKAPVWAYVMQYGTIVAVL